MKSKGRGGGGSEDVPLISGGLRLPTAAKSTFFFFLYFSCLYYCETHLQTKKHEQTHTRQIRTNTHTHNIDKQTNQREKESI